MGNRNTKTNYVTQLTSTELQSLKEFKEFVEYKYIATHITGPIQITDQIIGYKLAVVTDNLQKQIVDCCVILELGVNINDGIAESHSSVHVDSNSLSKGIKYCCKSCNVRSFRIICPAKLFEDLQKRISKGKLKIVSQFDSTFEYRLDSQMMEKNFCEPGKGCVKGIHFYNRLENLIKDAPHFCNLDQNKPFTIGPWSNCDYEDPGILKEDHPPYDHVYVGNYIKDSYSDIRIDDHKS